jgi:hypothetical protein
MKKSYLNLTLFLVIGLNGFSQTDPFINCIPNGFIPDPFENAATLCQTYGSQTPDLTIGEGTSFPYATDILGSTLDGKRINIIGDFTVDKSFTFKNCIIKINPGKAIFCDVQSLKIDNSKLFACDQLWKGIIMADYSSIYCRNNTIIEDAEGAIQSENPVFSFINLSNTTFNRNRIGVLIANSSLNIYPQISVFQNNRFTCTSPLNGTINEYSFAGIKSKNLNVITSQYAKSNYFYDLHYGIFTEGEATEISGSIYRMFRIKDEGIVLCKGKLDISGSLFLNCRINAVHVLKDQTTSIKATTFIINDQIINNNLHTAIKIDEFLPNSTTNITTSINATLNWSRFGEKIIGIHLQGNKVAGGCDIKVTNSSISIDNKGGIGINLPGLFPSSSNTLLENNTIRIGLNNDSPFNKIDYPTGISSIGDKNNVKIIANKFTGTVPFQSGNQSIGISIQNTTGHGNDVSSNQFYGIYVINNPPNPPVNIGNSGYYFRTGLIMENAMNFKVCNNINDNGADNGFIFDKSCLNTNFILNENYGSRYGTFISEPGVISEQKHKGNKWFPKIDKGWALLPYKYAACKNIPFVDQSRFIVHTIQSTGIWPFGIFNEFHPDYIEPDQNNEFFDADLNGSPSSACVTQLAATISETDIAIAGGLYSSNSSYPSGLLDANKYLFRKLFLNPELIQLNPILQTFYNNYVNTNVGYLIKAEKLLDDTYQLSQTISTNINSNLNNQALISEEIAILDSLKLLLDESDSSIVAQRILLTQQLANLQTQIESFYYQAKLDFYTGLDLAVNQLQVVSPQTIYEANEKSYLNIFLNSLRHQDGRITESQGGILKSIAEQCPTIGGFAVINARNLLPYCYSNIYEFCDEQINIPYGDQTFIYLGDNPLIGSNNLSNQEGLFSNLINNKINSDQSNSGHLYEIYNLSGQKIESSSNPIDIHNRDNFYNGIYLLVTTDISGKKTVSKFVILK